MRRIWFWMILISTIYAPFQVRAEGMDTIFINGMVEGSFRLQDQNMRYYCDTTHQLRYNNILQLGLENFKSTENGRYNLNLHHASHYWFRFVISNQSLNRNADLMFYFGKADKATLYQKLENTIDSLTTGRITNIQNRDYLDPDYLPISIKKGETSEFLFTVKRISDSYCKYPFSLQSKEFYLQKKTEEGYFKLRHHKYQGFFFGFLFLIIIFSFIRYLLEKDKAYLYYMLYLLGIFIYYLVGKTTTILNPFSYITEYTHPYSKTIAFTIFIAYVLFFLEFLSISKRNISLVEQMFRFMLWLLLVLLFIDFLLRYSGLIILYQSIYDIIRYILLVIAIILSISVFVATFKEYYARFIIVGTLFLLLFGLYNNLYQNGKIKLIAQTLTFTQIGILIEIVFFSIGLFLRSRGQLINTTELKQKLIETELKALRAQINPHFISNALNSIKQLVQNGKSRKAEEYLADFSQLIRTILNNSNESFIPLQREIDYCKEYLNIEALRFDGKFEYQIHIDKCIDTIYVKIPPLLLQPYIENAIWHGLLPKSGKRLLKISAIQKEEFVHLIIDDNGIGRTASTQNQQAQKQPTSLGMTITNERILTNNELYDTNIQLRIIDKKNIFGNANGTKVELILPL